ncbi:MAG: hypothetical protein AAFS12_02645 [Cyanobacteria bacterium J06632_19]
MLIHIREFIATDNAQLKKTHYKQVGTDDTILLFECQILTGIGNGALGMGRWALGMGHWALGMGHWALGMGRWAWGMGNS